MVDVRVTDGPETREEDEGEEGWKRGGDMRERVTKKKEDKAKTKHGTDLR